MRTDAAGAAHATGAAPRGGRAYGIGYHVKAGARMSVHDLRPLPRGLGDRADEFVNRHTSVAVAVHASACRKR
jgi:hypothetical protein